MLSKWNLKRSALLSPFLPFAYPAVDSPRCLNSPVSFFVWVLLGWLGKGLKHELVPVRQQQISQMKLKIEARERKRFKWEKSVGQFTHVNWKLRVYIDGSGTQNMILPGTPNVCLCWLWTNLRWTNSSGILFRMLMTTWEQSCTHSLFTRVSSAKRCPSALDVCPTQNKEFIFSDEAFWQTAFYQVHPGSPPPKSGLISPFSRGCTSFLM